ncbi:MAG: YlmC/YmxH family sporulation protein [Peptococcaceae bacterium]|nr:YlmC/YmxH family sporulation protein [Peptococcaceae bacterium]
MAAQISDLQERQIINIADGKCWGNIKDVELDLERGCIKSLILPGVSGLWSLLQSRGELFIPWEKVVRIGVDVILIHAEELVEEQQRLYKKNRRNRKLWHEEIQELMVAEEKEDEEKDTEC